MATGRILIANAQISGGVYGILNFNFTPLGGVQKNYNLSNYSGFNSDDYLDWYVDLNERHFWIKFKVSGYFKPLTSVKNTLYIFAIGGGGAGNGAGWNNLASIWSNGAGGSGGCIREGTFTIRYNDDPYLVTIGAGGTYVAAGGTENNGSSTIAFGITAPGGIGGSSSGAPWTYGYSAKTYNSDGKGGGGGGASDANAGQSGDDGEYAYGDSLLDGIKYGAGGGGGGGKDASGGSTGGGTGRPGAAGQANTGSGGGGYGGVGREGGSSHAGGAGGSGCVIIRNYTYL